MKGSLEIVATGKCRGCPEMDPDLCRLYAYDEVVEDGVICRNADSCDRLERWLLAKLTAAEKTLWRHESAD